MSFYQRKITSAIHDPPMEERNHFVTLRKVCGKMVIDEVDLGVFKGPIDVWRIKVDLNPN